LSRCSKQNQSNDPGDSPVTESDGRISAFALKSGEGPYSRQIPGQLSTHDKFGSKTGRLAVLLVSLITAIAIASTTAVVAIMTGATLASAFSLYVLSGMVVMLGMPLFLKSVELAVGILRFERAGAKEDELRLLEYHGNERA
jgi:hypothetical protein